VGTDLVVSVTVVLGRLRQRRRLRLPDVHTQRYRGGRLRGESLADGVGASVVEPHPVDQRLRLREPEQPRPAVARLALGGDTAHLDVAEAERGQEPRDVGVLVEPGGDPHRCRELHSPQLRRQPRVTHR